jgi:hypothetical protein
VAFGWCVGITVALVDDVHAVKKSMVVTNFVLLVNWVNISYRSLLTHLNPLNLLQYICIYMYIYATLLIEKLSSF